MGQVNKIREQINVFEWFVDKNQDNLVDLLTLDKKLDVSIVVTFKNFVCLCLSDTIYKDDSEIRYEVYTMTKLTYQYTAQIFVYVDGNLVKFDSPEKI